MKIRILILCFLICIPTTNVYGDGLDTDSLTQIENILDDQEVDVSYEEIASKLITGDIKGAISDLFHSVSNSLFHTLIVNKSILKQLLAVAIVASIFKGLSDSFFQGNAGETAFFVTYVIFIGLMVQSFFFMDQETRNLVNTIIDYMKGMISAFSLAVVSTSGITTSTAVYELYLAIIYGISLVVQSILLPVIKVLFVIKVVNHISEEEHFSKLCETLENLVSIALKIFLSIVLGIQMIQSMILPAVDSLKNTVLQKGASFLPGIGSGMNSVFTTILGSAIVIKNSIGATGILILLVIVIPPLIQNSILVLSYIGIGILVQPISDKRISGALEGIVQTGKLMLKVIVTITALFILSIAMIVFSTNVNYYAG